MSKRLYNRLLVEQDSRCKICSEKKRKLRLDKDPATGKVRGLLCLSCLSGLQKFQDSATILKKAIKYLNLPLERPKAIAIDLDDVCLDFINTLIKIHNNKYNTNFKLSDCTDWQLPESLQETFKQYESFLYVSLRPKSGVIEALTRFQKQGYKIVFITARPEKFRPETEFSLEKLNIPYDELFFNSRKALKLRRLEELYYITAFIDDKLSTVNKVKRETKIKNIFIVNMPSNKIGLLEKGIIRVNSINDIESLKD